jgi:alkaline phosphatase D
MYSAESIYMNLHNYIKYFNFKQRLKVVLLLTFSLFFLFSLNSCNKENQRAKGINKIAFGSGLNLDSSLVVLDSIAAKKPDVWVWMGNSIFTDKDENKSLKAKFYNLSVTNNYRNLLDSVKNILAIWDEYDYGMEDGNKYFKNKSKAKKEFLDFLEIPQNAPIRKRNGIYSSYTIGEEFKKIRIILLDTRTFQDQLLTNPNYDLVKNKDHYTLFNAIKNNNLDSVIDISLFPNLYEHYKLDSNVLNHKMHNNYITKIFAKYMPKDSADLLGKEQWQWLYNTLKHSDARINIIVSNLQIIPTEQLDEKWANFPNSRQKLFEIISETKPKGIIFLSGNRGKSEISKINLPNIDYPIYEITSSGLNFSDNKNYIEYNSHRVGQQIKEKSFGMLSFKWKIKEVKVKVELLGEKGVYQVLNLRY